MFVPCVFVTLALTSSWSASGQNVSVVTMQLRLDTPLTIEVSDYVEYILEYTPEPGAWAGERRGRVRLRSGGGDSRRPLLFVLRHHRGAQTWQLPYKAGERTLYEMDRTLCSTDCLPRNDSTCAGGGSFSLHVSARGGRRGAAVLLYAAELALPPQRDTAVQASLGSAGVLQYLWREGQRGVLLQASSQAAVCGAVLLLPRRQCPLQEFTSEVSLTTLRMSMLESGGVHVEKSSFPDGFLIVSMVYPDDVVCTGVEPEDEAWLWEDAVMSPRRHHAAAADRTKTVVFNIDEAPSPREYVLWSLALLLLLLLFYSAAGALLLLRRVPAWRRLVPRAADGECGGCELALLLLLRRVPAWRRLVPRAADEIVNVEENPTNQTTTRRRKNSGATLDNSDVSDTDSEAEEERNASGAADHAVAENHVPAGDRTVSAGNGAVSTGDGAVSAGDRAVSAGDRAVSAGDSAVTAGDGAVSAGDGAVSAGDGAVSARDRAGAVDGAPAGVDGEERQTTQDTPLEAGGPLRLAALARRRERTLRARADRYPPLLLTVAVFYALPALQLLLALQALAAGSGSLDACYYNFLCAWRAGALHDYNHVVSNLAYLLLGALLLLQLRRRRRRRRARPPPRGAGIPDHLGLLAALALAMMAVSLMSAAYHICPSRLSFQFDTSFMYVLAVLINVKLYQARHPDVNARAHATFAALAVIIALAVWGVVGGGRVFWALFSVLHVFAVLLLSVQLYYVGQFKFEPAALATVRLQRPRHVARFAAIAAANLANWALAIYGLAGERSDFAGHLLSVVLCNALLHMGYYLLMKRLHGERLRWYSAAVTAAAAACWLPALYLFMTGNSDWSVPAARSRRRNHRCVLLLYDAHDLWHVASAAALYLSLCGMLSWDDGLAATPRHRIPVF